MKTKTTLISSDDKSLTVTISVIDETGQSIDVYHVELPFSVVPPQISHQIASQLAMCNSYYVDNEK